MTIILFFLWLVFLAIGLMMFFGLVVGGIWLLLPKTGKTSAVNRD